MKSRMQSIRNSSTLRSEEHTSELQSQSNLVCRLLLERINDSTYCTTIEMPPFLARPGENGMILFPVLLSPCVCSRSELLAATKALAGRAATVVRNFSD